VTNIKIIQTSRSFEKLCAYGTVHLTAHTLTANMLLTYGIWFGKTGAQPLVPLRTSLSMLVPLPPLSIVASTSRLSANSSCMPWKLAVGSMHAICHSQATPHIIGVMGL